jgi:hypothetical protein
MQSQGNAGSQISTSSQQNKGRFIFVHGMVA